MSGVWEPGAGRESGEEKNLEVLRKVGKNPVYTSRLRWKEVLPTRRDKKANDEKS